MSNLEHYNPTAWDCVRNPNSKVLLFAPSFPFIPAPKLDQVSFPFFLPHDDHIVGHDELKRSVCVGNLTPLE